MPTRFPWFQVNQTRSPNVDCRVAWVITEISGKQNRQDHPMSTAENSHFIKLEKKPLKKECGKF